MGANTDFETMTEACIAAGHLVRRHGTPDLQAAMRVLLFILGGEAARRQEPDEGTEGAATNGARSGE